jgi:hypothetical protein
MKYFLSRQAYYYSGLLIVEIAAGGLDYSGADMLVEKYKHLGEGQEFNDPREAVEAAIAIARAWRKDELGKRIVIGHGHSMGMGLEFEGCSFKAALAWAKETYEKLEKCCMCGDLLPDEYYTDEFGDAKFCSERCVERNAEDQAKFNQEEEADDGEDSRAS